MEIVHDQQWDEMTPEQLAACVSLLEKTLSHAKREMVNRLLQKQAIPGYEPWIKKSK